MIGVRHAAAPRETPDSLHQTSTPPRGVASESVPRRSRIESCDRRLDIAKASRSIPLFQLQRVGRRSASSKSGPRCSIRRAARHGWRRSRRSRSRRNAAPSDSRTTRRSLCSLCHPWFVRTKRDRFPIARRESYRRLRSSGPCGSDMPARIQPPRRSGASSSASGQAASTGSLRARRVARDGTATKPEITCADGAILAEIERAGISVRRRAGRFDIGSGGEVVRAIP